MVFFHGEPEDDELTIGPIQVERDNLNDWHSEERSVSVDRRWFMNVVDWTTETSYDYYDPIREDVLRTIREDERSKGKVCDKSIKEETIKLARISAGPQDQLIRLHKMQRILIVWMRLKEAKEKNEIYDPLQDDEMFLRQYDFDLYYQDLAKMSRYKDAHDKVPRLPFYEEARNAIPDDKEWAVSDGADFVDQKYIQAMTDFIKTLNPREQKHFLNSLYRSIQKNDRHHHRTYGSRKRMRNDRM